VPSQHITSLLPTLGALALVLGVFAPAAVAGPSSPTSVAVSMGDSYISGEAGRWEGNSITPLPGNDGTDRACRPEGPACMVDTSRVYGNTDPGCHRSDTAEILTARLAVDERANISCSGGRTKNIFRAQSGGEGQNGEAPQADQLLPIARSRNVELIMLSIGGNDLGFASIIAACLQAYTAKTGPCEPSQQAKVDALVPKATAGVVKSIDEIRAVMAEAGYGQGDYRLVVQTYPSVVPRASETRYAELGTDRNTFGCPFYDQDLNWARDRAAPQIGAVAKTAAASRGVETLDLLDAFQGHEICAKTTQNSTPTVRPGPTGSEWGRFVGASTVQQGDLQEAFHPNAYGQRALGDCVTKLFAAGRGSFACAGAAGTDVDAMSLARVGDGGGGTGGAVDRGCIARRLPVGARNVGRLHLGLRRSRLITAPRLARLVPLSRSSKRVRYCVEGDRGRTVTAVFGPNARVRLLTTTARAHRYRGLRVGSRMRAVRRELPRLRRVMRGVYQAGPQSQRLIGVRRGRVRYLAVSSERSLRRARLLRTYLRRARL
jgi:lysophospholipase L1-like esterase